MAYFALHFCGTASVELCQTYFHHPALEKPIICVRGKTTGAFHYSSGSFQWTFSVATLSILFLNHKLAHLTGQDDCQAILIGGRGSLARSLNTSLEKAPNWMAEMFGTTQSGELLIKRILLRSNPCQNHVGPAAISLSPQQFSSDNIEVLLNGTVIESAEGILHILKNLRQALPKKLSASSNLLWETSDQESHSMNQDLPSELRIAR